MFNLTYYFAVSLPQMELPKSLATIFWEEKEVTKKIFQMSSVKQLVQACMGVVGQDDAQCYRILKYNPVFCEYIDTDMNETVKDMDKFNIFFKGHGASSVLVSDLYLLWLPPYTVHL